MSEPLITAPTAVAPVAPPVSGVDPTITLTKADLSALLLSAVTQGRSQGLSDFQAQPATPAEVPEVWSANDLLHAVVRLVPWHNERNARAAAAAVDRLFPQVEGE